MIQTAAIIWAVLATGLGIWAGISWLRCEAYADWLSERSDGFRSRAIIAENNLRIIKRTRHLAAKKARAAQLAQRAALVASTTEQIRKEIGR